MTNSAKGTSVVTVIGVGNMGGAMARRLMAQGWTVRVCDVVRERAEALEAVGAQLCDTAAQAAAQADVSIVAVVDGVQTRAVLFGAHGLAGSVRPGHTVLLCPTLAPDDVIGCAQDLQTRGIAMIDAPMSGGPQRALDGSMSLMLAAPQALLDQHQALLQTLAVHRHVIGECVGDAAKTKLVNNLAAGILLVGTAEVLALAERLGLDQRKTLDVMEQSSGQSWIGTDRMRRMLAGDQEPRAHMSLLTKDTRLALEAARAVGFQGPLGDQASAVFAQACQAGWDQLDDGALLAWLSRARPADEDAQS
jgi:putative dehydrogenase